ncbi:two-component system sensor histidine kinase NtrB [Kineobactrum salinum]|uniref:histidine kinase n=1 Tax=Kineobactrum salinum TaxID=2708301 RepID=A0A6C0U3U8_9GAMM|nr:PAS domain-containing sensor histidine kinase [Kineobactrum salinum]QIB64104.1 PAS domain S-box protein [Kineobactrum salinum]
MKAIKPNNSIEASRDLVRQLDCGDLLEILDGSPDTVAMFDRRTGLVVWVSAATARLHDSRKDELVGLHIEEILPSIGEGQHTGSEHGTTVTVDSPAQYRPGKFKDRIGNILAIEYCVVGIGHEDEKPLGLVRLREVSDVPKSTKQEERLRRFLNDSFGATMIVSDDGIIRYVAPSIHNILGYSEQEACGMSIRKLHHPDHRKRNRALVRNMPPDDSRLKSFETLIRHADGSYRHIEASVRNLKMHPDVGGYLVSFRDVTERVMAEMDARQRREEVHALDRYRTMAELGSSLAHELNQPVAAIRNYADGCLRNLDKPEGVERSRWALGQIAAEAERVTRIMRAVHNFTAHKQVQHKLLPIKEILEDILPFLTLKAQQSDAVLNIDIGPNLKAWCDKTLIGQVILNLALNAIDAVNHAPLPDRELTISGTGGRAGFIEITVSDRGVGMSKDQVESLFSSRATTKESGFGLGLMLCRSIIANHGGDIWVDSELGKGTTFRFTLPRTGQKHSSSSSKSTA